MKPRSQRRREERSGDAQGPVARVTSNGILIALLIGAGVIIAVLAIILLAGGDGDEEDVVQPTAAASTPVPLVDPQTEDEMALAELARRTIESLPNGTWAELYDAYTPEFQERCSREEFVETGEQSAQEQGAQLSLIRYVGVNDFSVEEATARLIIVGQIGQLGEYTIGAEFEKIDGEWLISPVDQTTGCQAFDRLSG